jgi:uncharacterized protein
VATVNDALVALAEHDAAIVRARHAAAHPRSLAAYDAALVELDALRASKRELDKQRTPLAQRAAALESEAATTRDRTAVLATRLEEATGAGRSLEAMVHERDALAARASALDDELLELLEQFEPLDDRDAVLREAAQRVVAGSDALAAAVATERALANASLVELTAQRGSCTAALDASLLARYEGIALRAGGIGAARLLDGRCGACRVAVPAAIVDRLEHGADPDAIAVCDECGRLLVR